MGEGGEVPREARCRGGARGPSRGQSIPRAVCVPRSLARPTLGRGWAEAGPRFERARSQSRPPTRSVSCSSEAGPLSCLRGGEELAGGARGRAGRDSRAGRGERAKWGGARWGRGGAGRGRGQGAGRGREGRHFSERRVQREQLGRSDARAKDGRELLRGHAAAESWTRRGRARADDVGGRGPRAAAAARRRAEPAGQPPRRAAGSGWARARRSSSRRRRAWSQREA